MSGPGFDIFISDLFNPYNALVRERISNPSRVITAGRRALSVLRDYQPLDDGEAILIGTAIEEFENLIRRADGNPH